MSEKPWVVQFENGIVTLKMPVEAYVNHVLDAREVGGKAAALVEEQLQNMDDDGRKVIEDLINRRHSRPA